MKLLTVTAALIYERSFTEAGESLARVTAEARAGGFDLVRGNCLELSAQLAIEMKDYAGAMNHLDLAEQRLRHTESAIERLWVLKWRAMAESLAPARVTESLMKVSALAASAGHWETVRHCELSGALINRDVNSLTRVFFGTPYANYRKRIVDDAGAWYLPPEIYTLDSGALNVRSIDLSDGHFEDGTTVVARGQIPHLLLIALSRDFYRPLPLVAAFAQLFPEEYFNAVSSPTRVHHAVRRLREALSAMETGMIIVHERGLTGCG